MKKKKVVIALGGNAIQAKDATAEAQQHALKETARQLVKILQAGYDLIITHGNGPQVGNIVLQQQASHSEKTPAMPLDTCGAMSQGMIGYWMENALEEAMEEAGIQKNTAAVVTRVEVSPDDPAFLHPSKPIGPFYTAEEAKKIMETQHVVMKEDAGRGFRRIVPSPEPVNILEHEMISQLVEGGQIVIAVGGGGIPVIRKPAGHAGVEAVIDKDFASWKLAELVDADVLLILTAVGHVCIHYREPDEKRLTDVSISEMKTYMERGEFQPGSMLPKVEAAVRFAESKPKRRAIITSLGHAFEALEGRAGTQIMVEQVPV